jgi:predicted metal-dependent phosphotriesterase family hydrolase
MRCWTYSRKREFMQAEIVDGIDGTGFRAGHVKCGLQTMSDFEVESLQAAAAVADETGLPVPCQNSMQVLDQVFFWVG